MNAKTARRLGRYLTSDSRQCTKCHLVKPVSQFHKMASHPDGIRPECRDCANARNGRYYLANKQKVNERQRAFRKTDYRKAYARKYMAARLRRQRDESATRPRPLLCEACGSAGDQRGLVFDHNHGSGEFRGWLCNRCNRVLGMCDDSVSVLRQLAAYLEKANGKKGKRGSFQNS